MESIAYQLREVLRSFPYLQQTHQKAQASKRKRRRGMTAMLYEEGGYFDKLFKGHQTFSKQSSGPELPANTPLNARLSATRLHRLKKNIEA